MQQPVYRPKVNEIKSHAFFNKIDWNEIEQRRVTPPMKPNLTSEDDARNLMVKH